MKVNSEDEGSLTLNAHKQELENRGLGRYTVAAHSDFSP